MDDGNCISYFAILGIIHLTTTVLAAPTWPANCTFQLYPYHRLSSRFYATTTSTSEVVCRGSCLTDTHCGAYQWDSMELRCGRAAISVRLAEQVLGISPVLTKLAKPFFTGSRDCDAHIPWSDCTSYPQGVDRSAPPYSPMSSPYIAGPRNQSFSEESCFKFCSLYEDCVTVTYRTFSRVHLCIAYTESIQDLELTCRGAEVTTNQAEPIFISYRRHCSNGIPYRAVCPLLCLNGGKCQMNASVPYCDCGPDPSLAPPRCKKMNGIQSSTVYNLIPGSVGFRALNHTLVDVVVSSVGSCAIKCHRHPACVAFNYNKKSRNCGLLDTSEEMLCADEMVADPNNQIMSVQYNNPSN